MSNVLWPALNPIVTEEAGTRDGTHSGIDLLAERGDPVIAPWDGEVIYAGGDGASGALWIGYWLYPNGEGRTVDIRRADGLISRVGHLDAYAVKTGDRVTAGQIIGYAGDSGYSTGVHIHWETRWDQLWSGGNWMNPRDLHPQIYAPELTPKPEVPKKKPRRRIPNMFMVSYKNGNPAGGKGWLIVGTPKPEILNTAEAARGILDQWAAPEKGGNSVPTDRLGWLKFLRMAGYSAEEIADMKVK